MRLQLKNLKVWPVLLAILLVAAGVGGGLALRGSTPGNPILSVRVAEGAPPTAGFADVVSKDLPAVVSISIAKVVKTSGGSQLPFDDPFFRRFFGDDPSSRMPRQQRERGEGSGVIVSPDGYIVTNNHVVDGATQVQVKLADRREFRARVVGTDPRSDIAVLKIDADHLPVVTFADSSKVRVGDYALAVGNPFGIGQTVTLGIISATGRGNLGIEDYEDFIQTDAAINPGNSGGALVNAKGELIGINTAILSPGQGGNNGVGFAIPSNMAKEVMEQLVKQGKVTRAFIGVMLQPLTPDLASALGAKSTSGALVADVTADSPAAKAGIEKGDIITSWNGEKIHDTNQLKLRVGSSTPGATVPVAVLRDGSEKTLDVKLAEMPAAKAELSRQDSGKEDVLSGVEVTDLNPRLMRQLNLPARTKGVVVTDVDSDSRAAEAGLRPGDVIEQANRQPVASVAQLQDALGKSNGKNVLLRVNREGNNLFIAVEANNS